MTKTRAGCLARPSSAFGPLPEIRLLTSSDATEFRTLRLRALREEPESFGTSEAEFATTPIADVANRLRASDNAFVLGAVTPALIGTVGFHRREGAKKRHKGIIWGVYVAPEYRGQKVAHALMEAAIARASALPQLECLNLTVALKNKAAHRLYQSMGFKSYGIDRRSMKLGAEYVDEDLMELQL